MAFEQLSSALQIVREIAKSELPLTRQLMSLFVYFHIVARNCEGVLSMLSDMRAHGFEPSQELLEMALKRMEREGHKKGIERLVGEIGGRNWKMFSARNVVSLLPNTDHNHHLVNSRQREGCLDIYFDIAGIPG